MDGRAMKQFTLEGCLATCLVKNHQLKWVAYWFLTDANSTTSFSLVTTV